MSLAPRLRPLMAAPGMVVAVVFTRDGLPVEMLGHGLRADQLAAELASVARASRLAMTRLRLGEVSTMSFELEPYQIEMRSVGYHYLAAVCRAQEDASRQVVRDMMGELSGDLRSALGGNA